MSAMRPNPANYRFDLEHTLRGVVGLQATIPASAPSADRLGTEREGSGCVISDDGLVVTVGYLVTDAESIWLVSEAGKASPAHLVGRDQDSGLALVQALEPLGVPAFRLGQADRLRIGERVVVAGAGGLDHALDARVVARQEFAGYWEYLLEQAIFTTPPHPHWAGAALIAGHGGLAGIGSLFVQEVLSGRQVADVNMMIPIDLLPPIVDDLVRYGRVRKPPRPWVGMQATEFGENLVVVSMTDGGPAQQADIRVGDVIVGIDGEQVESLADLFRRMWACGEAGVTIPFDVFRNGERMVIPITSRDRNRNYRSPRLH